MLGIDTALLIGMKIQIDDINKIVTLPINSTASVIMLWKGLGYEIRFNHS